MDYLRTITGFAGKANKAGLRAEYSEPKILTTADGATYVLLIFGAVIVDGELLTSTIRAYFAPKELLLTIIPSNTMVVSPIEED